MIFKILIEIINGFFEFILYLIPPLPIWNNLNTAVSSVSWLWKAFGSGIEALGYIAGDNLLVVLPLIVNAVLLPIELTISFIWLILYKTHIAGGGH